MPAWFGQTVRYGIVGASATAVEWLAYFALTRGIPWFAAHYLIANVCSFSVSLVWGYVFHRRFTFRAHQGRHRAQFPKFLAVTLVGLGISTIVLRTGVAVFHVYDLYAKVAALAITALWNFSGQRLWTFRSSRAESRDDLSATPGRPYTDR